MRKIRTIKERFDEKYVIDDTTNCWNWTASKWAGGRYGKIHSDKIRGDVAAHRISYEIHKGEIPKGMEILHECDNSLCVNPDHLRIGTHQDNMNDMVKRKRHGAGERHNKCKITDAQVLEMIKLKNEGIMLKDIAPMYNIHSATVSRLTRNMRKES